MQPLRTEHICMETFTFGNQVGQDSCCSGSAGHSPLVIACGNQYVGGFCCKKADVRNAICGHAVLGRPSVVDLLYCKVNLGKVREIAVMDIGSGLVACLVVF